MFDSSTLLTGGIVAAVVAGWQQVKTVFSYISSFLISTGKYSSSLTLPILRHVRENYRMLPSGKLFYNVTVKNIDNDFTFVPYRTLPATSIFFRGFRFIIIKYNVSGLTITTIRGLVDLDEIAGKSAIEDYNRFASVRRNRFYVTVVRGEEKHLSSTSITSSRSTGSSEISDSSASPELMPEYDKLLGFDEKQIATNSYEENLIFDSTIEAHIEDAKLWKKSRQWYKDRQIPWKRGWCLYGPPGSGKSSLAREVAFRLQIPIHVFMLNTLSDIEFDEKWYAVERPCVILFEDFDNVFDGRTALSKHQSLSFDCVLNTISGVNSKDGVFLIVTTNHLNKLDPALGIAQEGTTISTRPGRIDRAIHVGPMSDDSRKTIIKSILRDWPEDHDSIFQQTSGMVVAQVQETCIQHAFNKLAS